MTVRPVAVTIGQEFILSLFGVEVDYTAAAATAADVVAGLAAAIAASTDPEWDNVTTEISSDGGALLISYDVTAGDLKVWRGDAPAVAQVTRLTPVDVQVGKVFGVIINGKAITYTATTTSAVEVATALQAAIETSTIPEFNEFTAVLDGSAIVLTADTAGVPFTVIGGTGTGTVRIDRVQSGSSGTSAVQTFTVPVTLQGSFKLTFNDASSGAIAAGASAGTVQTAVQAISTIGSGNCTVARTTTADGNDYVYTLTFASALANQPLAPVLLVADVTGPSVRRTQLGSSTGTFQNEIQTITVPASANRWFVITKDGQSTAAIGANASADTIRDAIVALSSVAESNLDVLVTVVEADTDIADLYPPRVVTVEFSNLEGNATQSLMTIGTWTNSDASPFSANFKLDIPAGITEVGLAPKNETQTLTLIGGPTGGTFTISFNGHTTSAIAYNAAAATVETAFEALTSVGSGNGTVTGSAGGPWTIAFTGAKATIPQNLVTCTSSLTGGVSESMSVINTTESGGPNHWDDSLNWAPVGVPEDFDRVRFESGRVDCLYGLDQSGIILTELEFLASYTGSVGLPRDNAGGYREYRTRELTVNVPSILIGHGDGSGSGKIQLNTLETTVYFEVRATGSSREPGVPAVTWYGNNPASEILLYSGEFGVAIWSDQLAVLSKVEQYGGQLRLDHATLDYLYAPGQSWTAHETVCGRVEA